VFFVLALRKETRMLRNLLIAVVVFSSGSMAFGQERCDDGRFWIIHENPHICTVTVQRGDFSFILLDGRCVFNKVGNGVTEVGNGVTKVVKGAGSIIKGAGSLVIGTGCVVINGVKNTGGFLIHGVKRTGCKTKRFFEEICPPYRPRCCCPRCNSVR